MCIQNKLSFLSWLRSNSAERNLSLIVGYLIWINDVGMYLGSFYTAITVFTTLRGAAVILLFCYLSFQVCWRAKEQPWNWLLLPLGALVISFCYPLLDATFLYFINSAYTRQTFLRINQGSMVRYLFAAASPQILFAGGLSCLTFSALALWRIKQ